MHILVEWGISWVFNGVLKLFTVSTEETSSKDIAKVHDSKPEVEIQVTEEIPTYNFTVIMMKKIINIRLKVKMNKMPYLDKQNLHY